MIAALSGGGAPVLLDAAALLASMPVGAALARAGSRFRGVEALPQAWMAAASAFVALSVIASSPPMGVSLALGWTLLLLAAIDIAALRLPDPLTLPLALLGLAAGGVGGASLPERLIGAAIGLGAFVAVDLVYVRLRGRTGLGFGDAKLFGAAGAWLGWRPLPGLLLIACAAGLAWVAVRLLRRGSASASEPLPFGAPLCLAFWMVWLSPR